jgi:hypothetical protein
LPSTSTSTSTKRKYTSSKYICRSDGNDSGQSVEPTRIYKVMSPTQHAGQSFESGASPREAAHHGTSDTNATTATTMISTPSSEYEDYDPDNLEMPMSATTSMDYEDTSGCDSLDMEDVMSVREARRVWDSEHSNHVESKASTVAGQDKYLTPTKFESGADGDDLKWYSDGIEEEAGGDVFVEIEEDWEVLHEQVHAGDGGDDAQAEEDGDVAIDW